MPNYFTGLASLDKNKILDIFTNKKHVFSVNSNKDLYGEIKASKKSHKGADIMSKNIWIINQYITSPKMCGTSHRHFSLAKYLAATNEITLFSGSFSHLHENKTDDMVFEEEGVKIVNLKIIKYRNTLTRILNFFHFVVRLRFFDYKQMEKPDIIVISTMSLFPLLLINFYKITFKNVKIIHEIRDIWPLTPITLGGYSEKHPFIKLLRYCEKLGCEKSDYFVSNLEFANKHISNISSRKDIPFTWISNGADTEAETEDLSEDIVKQIPKGKFLIGYAGTIGISNAMNTVIDAVNNLGHTNICLCIVGDGAEKEKLLNRANSNVLFLGKIPKKQVLSFLSRMDACVLSWKNTELYQYGISPNKIFDYMNAGKPIIMSGGMKNSIVEKSNCGWVAPASDVLFLEKLLLEVSKLNEDELIRFGQRGKDYLDIHFKYSVLAQKYQTEVFDKL